MSQQYNKSHSGYKKIVKMTWLRAAITINCRNKSATDLSMFRKLPKDP